MLKPLLEKLLTKQNLSAQESAVAMQMMLSNGNSTNTANSQQIAALLALMRAKPETADELLGMLKILQTQMIRINASTPVLDIVGTGGDRSNSINISTGASIIAAACGVKIAKHGNRSVSSQCGAADVLEALGVNIECQPQTVIDCIEQIGIGFCFAPKFHPALKTLAAIRKNLAIPTCFNLLGPLLNPVQAEYLMIGVFDPQMVDVIATILGNIKLKHALVFHGAGKFDELSCIGPTQAIAITPSGKEKIILDPQSFGFSRCSANDLRGGSPQENAQTLLKTFAGEQGAISDTLIFNAAVAAYIYGKAPSITAAISLVKKNIQNNNVMKTLQQLITLTRSKPNGTNLT